MSQTIEIIVSPTGQAQVQTNGFIGGSCRHASLFIEQALGRRVEESLTPEFHQQANQQISQQSRNR